MCKNLIKLGFSAVFVILTSLPDLLGDQAVLSVVHHHFNWHLASGQLAISNSDGHFLFHVEILIK